MLRLGLRTEEALAAVLAMRHRSPAFDRGPLPDSDALVEALVEEGCSARLVQAAREDLRSIEAPFLALLHGDRWVVVRRVTARKVHLGPPCAAVDRSAFEEAWTGSLVELQDSILLKGGLWRRCFQVFHRFRGAAAGALGAALAAQVLALLTPWCLALAVDRALPAASPSWLGLLGFGLAASGLFRAWAAWLQELSLQALGVAWEAALSGDLLDHVLSLPFRLLQARPLGEFLQAFAGLQRARHHLMDRGLGALLTAFSALGFWVGLLVLLPSPALPAALLAAGLLFLAFAYVVGLRQRALQSEEVAALAMQRSALAELLRGMATWKATGALGTVLDRWERPLGRGLAFGLRRERWGLVLEVLRELLGPGLSALLLLWGVREVLAGHLSLGALLAIVQLAAGFFLALHGLALALAASLALGPQTQVLQELYAHERELPPMRRALGGLPGPLTATDLGFRYTEEGPWVLQNASLHLEPGTFHPLQGPSGSGKSTLLKVLAGLYPPERGQVRYGGLTPKEAASLLAYLPQSPQLIGGSILDNLRLLSGGVPAARLREAAAATGLAAWVEGLPMGYDTLLASGGGNLSGGQRQLIAVTAILASDRPVLLLDEALSNLDWVARRRVLQCPLFRGRTVVYASHEEILK